jgi:hypothetical protein
MTETTIQTAETTPALRFQCRHIFTDGHRCGGPSLRHQELCYFHHTTRRPVENPAQRKARLGTFELQQPSDLSERSGIQLAIGEVLQRIASNDLDPRRAGLLLYGLQIASLNLPKPAPDADTTHLLVDTTTQHPTLGTLAPQAEMHSLEPKSSITQLLEDLENKEKSDLEQQRQTLEDERQQLAKERNQFEAERAAFQAKQAERESAAQPLTLTSLQATAEAPHLIPNPCALIPALSPEPVRRSKLVPQLRSPQILPQMRQPLLQREQRRGHILRIRQRHIAPHAVGTRPQPRRFAQPTSANRLHRRHPGSVMRKLVLQQRSQRRRQHLRQV